MSPLYGRQKNQEGLTANRNSFTTSPLNFIRILISKQYYNSYIII